MTLDRADIEAIADALEARISNRCECGLDPKLQRQVGHFFSMLGDVGAGDAPADETSINVARGVELHRKMLTQYKESREWQDYVKKTVTYLFVFTVGGAILSGIAWGIYEGGRQFILKIAVK